MQERAGSHLAVISGIYARCSPYRRTKDTPMAQEMTFYVSQGGAKSARRRFFALIRRKTSALGFEECKYLQTQAERLERRNFQEQVASGLAKPIAMPTYLGNRPVKAHSRWMSRTLHSHPAWRGQCGHGRVCENRKPVHAQAFPDTTDSSARSLRDAALDKSLARVG